MQHELKLAGIRIKASEDANGTTKKAEGSTSPKLPPFDEKKDDLDAYLYRFEKYAKAHKWPESCWASNLSALLKGKALPVYEKLGEDDYDNYEKLKEGLLRRYRLTETGFRDKFRQAVPETDESFGQYVIRLKGYLDRWVELAGIDRSFEALEDLLVRELRGCTKELRLFVQERHPKCVEELTKLAESYLEVHEDPYAYWSKKNVPHKTTPKQSSFRPYTSYNSGSGYSSVNPSKTPDHQNGKQKPKMKSKQCWLCKETGHLAYQCKADSNATSKTRPKESQRRTEDTAFASMEQNYFTLENGLKIPVKSDGKVFYCIGMDGRKLQVSAFGGARPGGMPVVQGRVNSAPKFVEVLRDTGCSGAVVRQELCKKDSYTGLTKSCLMINGEVVNIPVAKVNIDSPYYSGEVEALAMENPPYDVIIGNLPEARDANNPDPSWQPKAKTVLNCAAVTRSKTEELVKSIKPLKVSQSKVMGVTLDQFRTLQEADSTLAKIRRWIEDGKGDNPRKSSHEVFYHKDQVMYRDQTLPPSQGSAVITQLIVPQKLRAGIMELAHDSILGGHMAGGKTLDRVKTNFYWPGIGKDAERYCQSCDKCQRSVPRGKVGKVPLGDMPIVGTPFDKVAIDLIGPLPASKRGHRWIITLVDYATRYPEAKPLKTTDTAEVAEALVEIFSRLGIPKKMVSDQGTQFTSNLMTEISRLLSINQITTTPYHAMANGLVERFNGTLKQMLKKMCMDAPLEWDRYLPAVLFAYREVPQDSTKFSPFEMLYGRSVRGPMEILKQVWTDDVPDEETRNTYQYVLELRERLAQTCQLAHEELRKAKMVQKNYYDRKARERKMVAGDKVLLLLPSDNKKLLMQWKGPFEVVEPIGQNDYKILIYGKVRTFHANMLKKYVERPTTLEANAVVTCIGSLEMEVISCAEVYPGSEIDEYLPPCCPLEANETWKDVAVDSTLDDQQREQVEDLLQEYSDVLSDLPGKCDILEATINLEQDAIPFRQKPYPVPHALEHEMSEEIEKMKRMNIIEPSISEFSSPSVIVKKPDKSWRYCLDFRKLNSMTKFDSEPIPNQEVIIAKLGESTYFTKLDLAKGYGQIPIKQEDRHLTAFSTPQGLFQFKYLPFGLVNAGAIFCRMVRHLLHGLEDVESYIDDIVVHSKNWDSHLRTVQVVLERLRMHGLTAKPSKCEVGQKSIPLLGHVVGQGHVKLQEEKAKAILNSKRPSTKKQLRSFLGTVGFYRRFIDKYAEVAKPLTDLTKGIAKEGNIAWNDAAEQSFQTLKSRISQYPILRLPNFGKPFILRTDASKQALGAVLLQEHNEEVFPVLYISRKLTAAESRFSAIERECLGLIWAVEKLRYYLLGKEFFLETDHQPLRFINKNKISNDRVMRWALVLQEYKFRVKIVKSSDNVGADYLSRTEQML